MAPAPAGAQAPSAEDQYVPRKPTGEDRRPGGGGGGPGSGGPGVGAPGTGGGVSSAGTGAAEGGSGSVGESEGAAAGSGRDRDGGFRGNRKGAGGEGIPQTAAEVQEVGGVPGVDYPLGTAGWLGLGALLAGLIALVAKRLRGTDSAEPDA